MVKRWTSAQVMISLLVSLSPTSVSVLTAQSLEPALASVYPSLSLPLPCSNSVWLSKINIKKKSLVGSFRKILLGMY